MYRVYLRTHDQRVLAESKTTTKNQAAAAQAFADLVNRTDLDGQKIAAALTYNNRQLAYHRFDREPGQADYWRDRLDEIEWPRRGRPSSIRSRGQSRNIYLDDDSWQRALDLGDGNASEGIRRALAQATND